VTLLVRKYSPFDLIPYKEIIYVGKRIINNLRHSGDKRKIENAILDGREFEKFVKYTFLTERNKIEIIYETGKNRESSPGDRTIDFAVIYKGTKPYVWAGIECKYRREVSNVFQWATENQFNKYNYLQKYLKIPIYIIIGVGGLPNNPKELYFIPLDKLNSHNISLNQFDHYRISSFDDMVSTMKPHFMRYYYKKEKNRTRELIKKRLKGFSKIWK